VAYLSVTYSASTVVGSILIASYAAFVALGLAQRLRSNDRLVGLGWWLSGSIAMGTGIWAMHFISMLGLTLPIELGYSKALTFVSWGAGVAASAVALSIASRERLNLARLAGGSVAMSTGICAMHYIGMLALEMQPAIDWDLPLVLASVAIALLASAASLRIFFWMRTPGQPRGPLHRGVAALVMGLAMSGMHYTGMLAAGFPEGAVCLNANSLNSDSVGLLVVMATLGILTMTLVTSAIDAHMQGRTLKLAGSLKRANEELQSANLELHRRAFLDALTGLPNRLLFEDRLMHALARCDRAEQQTPERQPHKLSVLFVDLDGFKPVNDLFGHGAGDAVLVEAAARLRATARESDTVARVGGDEFLLLMEDLDSVADCVTLATRVVEALAEPFHVTDRPVQVTCSVGVVVYPEHGQRDKLVANADAAMYVAKRSGGNSFALFEVQMDELAQQQLRLQHDLRLAVELHQLELHYQPKVDGISGRIRGVEALLRWNHPERKSVAPEVFIPIAERFGMINHLGRWVIEEACRQIHVWSLAGVRMRVAINLSAHQLGEADLAQRIQETLRRHHVPPSLLLCEITETTAMEDLKATQRAIEELARIGVFLSIDDFGTGYSSLSYLRQLPARQLKIDRSFVQDVETSMDARAVVDAVVRLAHALGLRVVAEGVETAGQRDFLVGLGCDELQGFFFARPMPAATLLEWTAGHKPENTVDFSHSVLADRI
jgi:diguanylate cyclase